jgi:hypothetical protein
MQSHMMFPDRLSAATGLIVIFHTHPRSRFGRYLVKRIGPKIRILPIWARGGARIAFYLSIIAMSYALYLILGLALVLFATVVGVTGALLIFFEASKITVVSFSAAFLTIFSFLFGTYSAQAYLRANIEGGHCGS